MLIKNYKTAIKELKSMILTSRYRAAALANRELLLLYFSVGKYISEKANKEEWGAKVIQQLSTDLQNELPGLRGFSSSNLKRMRWFYEAWAPFFVIGPSVTDQLQKNKNKPSINEKKSNNMVSLSIGPTPSDQLEVSYKNANNSLPKKADWVFGPTVSDQFVKVFFSISFSHHNEIISKCKFLEERKFYINKTANEFWSLDILEHQINSNLFKKQGKLLNNFNKAIENDKQREKALQTFKDEYLLDFINIEDADFTDEKEIENEIVRNIRKFVLSIGTDFAFIGNQYRLVIEDDEWFIDLLFYNRKLQCLVAFEIKKGKFKPEYLGKMNFYLTALDETVKQPHENPSIGIILCKSKTDKVVEFSFRDFNKAMGVATYKTSKELPAKYKGILPDAKTLKKFL